MYVDIETLGNVCISPCWYKMPYRKEAVDDVAVTQEQVEKIANQIEVKLFNLHGDINTKYKTKYRSLLFNLKDTKNQVYKTDT